MKKILTMLLVTLAFILVIGNSSEALAATKFQTVKFNSGGGTAIAAKKVVFQALLSSPKKPKRTGYTFVGWYQNKTLTKVWNFKTSRVKKNVTLYAKWKPITYKVTFNSKGGSAVSKQTVAYKGLMKKPKSPIRIGYSFVSWYKDTKYKKGWSFTKDRITKNVTVYAKWKKQSARSVSFDSTGGTAVASVAVAHNSLLNPPTPQKTGFTFAGWFKNPSLTTPWNAGSSRVSSNIVLYAKWTPIICTISFDTKGGTVVNPQAIPYGTFVAQPAIPSKVGYTFAGWCTSPDLVAGYNFVTAVTGNMTLYAKWNVSTNAYRAIVTASALNVRTTPDSSRSDNLLNPALSKNAIINIVPSGIPGWYLTDYNGQTAYIASEITDVNNNKIKTVQATAYACKVMAATGTNIYAGIDPTASVVGTLTYNSYVNVIPYIDNPSFVQVSPSAGVVGYAHVSDLQELFYDTLNIHTPSPVTADQINNFIVNYETKNSKTSVFHGLGQTFINVGNDAGINPVILAAMAMHESGYGTSNLARCKYNIFSIAAYDAPRDINNNNKYDGSTYASAYTFKDPEQAIRYQADFLNTGYLNSPYSNRGYKMMGDFLGTNGLPGLNSTGQAGVNAWYASDYMWGQKIASICEQIVPYDPNYYTTATPMVAKVLNYQDLTFLPDIDNNFNGFNITGKCNLDPSAKNYPATLYPPLLLSRDGSDVVKDSSGNTVYLAKYGAGDPANNGTFRVLHLYGNRYNGWMQIITTFNGSQYTGFINFGGLSGYTSRFTLDNLLRNENDLSFTEQFAPFEVNPPVGYVKCYRQY